MRDLKSLTNFLILEISCLIFFIILNRFFCEYAVQVYPETDVYKDWGRLWPTLGSEFVLNILQKILFF